MFSSERDGGARDTRVWIRGTERTTVTMYTFKEEIGGRLETGRLVVCFYPALI